MYWSVLMFLVLQELHVIQALVSTSVTSALTMVLIIQILGKSCTDCSESYNYSLLSISNYFQRSANEMNEDSKLHLYICVSL